MDDFLRAIKGRVIRPEDAEYESARRVYNADIDRRPLLIVQCAGAADVVHCVNYARENKLLIAVRGGGAILHGKRSPRPRSRAVQHLAVTG